MSFLSTAASSTVVSHVGTPGELPGLVAGWGLPPVRGVVVLLGGAAGMSEADTLRAARAVAEGVCAAVVEAGAALVDGGTDAGVMLLAGRARADSGATFPLVGVVPEGVVGARIEPHHTHVLAVPGSAWGDETPWLFRLAQEIAGDRAVVAVLINGGPIARREIAEGLRLGRRIIIVAGTGRAADELAGASALGDGDDPERHTAETGLLEVIDADQPDTLRARLLSELREGTE